MSLFKTIRLFFLVYTLYTVWIVCVSNYPIAFALVGLVLLWLLYYTMKFGYSRSIAIYNHSGIRPRSIYIRFPDRIFFLDSVGKWNFFQYLLNAIVCWGCTILAAQYYTGRGVLSVVNGWFGTNDAYNTYQTYFRTANIASFSISSPIFSIYSCGDLQNLNASELIRISFIVFVSGLYILSL